uniref:DNA replication fork stabilization factor DONSON n=1 Tax=Hucho hucho TaxID=62062 RepID=A0A4W5K3L5_9TELE
MSQQAGYSPSFKRPAEILRMRRKTVRSEGVSSGGRGEGASIPAVRPFSPGPLFGQGRSGGGVKRRNPFASIENTFSSPAKKKVFIYTDDDADSSDSVKPDALFSSNGHTKVRGLFWCIVSQHFILCVCVCQSPKAGAVTSIAPPACVEYPADWSLKTHLLFTSLLPFSWAEQPRATEEAQGLTQHCRGQYTTIPQSIQDPRSSAELRCGFQQCLQFWQHPSLSWLSLFPRIGAERSFTGKNVPWAQDMALQQSFMSECVCLYYLKMSLSSLYSLLKARLCPYFYVCSYQFTALFRASGLAGNSRITALLTPTTRGLREAMKADVSIEFTLPLLEERRKSKEQGPTEDCDNDDDDGGFSWLTEMGVQDKIKKPDNISIKLHKERNSVCLDHKPESVVCVSGAHTFTLINFLINCKTLVAGAGSQAGLPPHPTGPYSLQRSYQAVELDGCGLHPSTIQQLQEPSTLGKSSLRQLHLNNYSYTWKS